MPSFSHDWSFDGFSFDHKVGSWADKFSNRKLI
jgi:hypothetical protein